MTIGTAAAADGDDPAVIGGDRVDCFPAAAVTGGTIATRGKVLTDRDAAQGAVGVVTAAAGVVRFVRTADQGVVVTVGTVARADLDQAAVIRRVDDMSRFPTAAVTGGTGTATGRH